MGVASGAVERKSDPSIDDTGAFVRREAQRGRFGGARADFVASLGRRAVELGHALTTWQGDPGSVRARDDLARRVHGLSAGARLLRFADLADQLAECEGLVEAIIKKGTLDAEDVAALRQTFDRMPALAWTTDAKAPESMPAAPPLELEVAFDDVPEPLPRAAESSGVSTQLVTSMNHDAEPQACPQTALVVGPAQLADALTREVGDARESASEGWTTFDVERTDDPTVAIDLARAFAPDVVVVDADIAGARQLVEALLSDPLTEPVPIVVLGKWARPEDAAPYVALGVAKALLKPVSPDALRRACADVTASYVRREIVRAPLGSMTLDELGARLAEELRKGLCDAATTGGRSAQVALGEGSDVLAALWGAVARIRDVVTIRSDGAVRFAAGGPEGALPLAPWLGAPEGDLRGAMRAHGDARSVPAPSLEKAVIVVADDDPAVTWFIAGLLKDAGAIVHEARDGARALELAFRVSPDLVISDVLMPELDGFALCRALKRDLVLRDVPVILLSWKEDLLQRVRELGAAADGYLRKEATASSIVQRVREVLRPRARVADRLAAGGEVRGRLDGLTTHTLLGLACMHRPASTLSVRDATFLYEVEIREGRPARATRTAVDGTFQRGPLVLAALLGVGAGRFVVTPLATKTASPVRPDLVGALSQQLLPLVAKARAAQRLLSGSSLVHVDRAKIDETRLAAYADATPEPARTLLRALCAGASPREVITSGQAPARLVEDVLCDAAAHGAIDEVIDMSGADVLACAIVAEMGVLRGVRKPAPMPPPPDLPMLGRTPLPERVGTPAPAIAAQPTPSPAFAEGPVTVTPVLATRTVDRAAARPVERAAAQIVAPQTIVAARPAQPPPPKARPVSEPPPERRAPGVPASLGSLEPPPVAPRAPEPPPQPAPPAPRDREASDPMRNVRAPSSYLAAAAPVAPAPRDTRISMWIAFAVAGLAFAIAARWAREHTIPEPVVAALVAAAPAAAEPPAAPEAPPAPTLDPTAEDLSLRTDDKVAEGQGMLEIVAGTGNTIYVDGRLIGQGPVVKLPLAPKSDPYEVRVQLRGEDQIRFVAVKPGRLTRLRVAPPWSR